MSLNHKQLNFNSSCIGFVIRICCLIGRVGTLIGKLIYINAKFSLSNNLFCLLMNSLLLCLLNAVFYYQKTKNNYCMCQACPCSLQITNCDQILMINNVI